MIEGYYDGLLGPAGCASTTISGNPAWNGVFSVASPLVPPPFGYCRWDGPAGRTMNGGQDIANAILLENGGRWEIEILGNFFLFPPPWNIFWWGQSPPGTGGACSTPIGLTFTRGGNPPLTFICPSPATLKIVAV